MFRDNQEILKWVNVYIISVMVYCVLAHISLLYIRICNPWASLVLRKINSINLSNCYAKFGYYICPRVGTLLDTFQLFCYYDKLATASLQQSAPVLSIGGGGDVVHSSQADIFSYEAVGLKEGMEYLASFLADLKEQGKKVTLASSFWPENQIAASLSPAPDC